MFQEQKLSVCVGGVLFFVKELGSGSAGLRSPNSSFYQ
jgi:hypothetical protein